MKAFVRRHPAATYFALAFALSWGGIFAVIRGGEIPAPPAEAQRLFVYVYIAMLVGPSVAGVLMTCLVDGRDGLRAYRDRLFKWRVDARWYAAALLTAPLALAVTAILLAPISRDFVPVLLGTGQESVALPLQARSNRAFVVQALLVGLGAGLFEELGWTGFAIPSLRKRYTVMTTALTVGVLWGAWHFLAVLWGGASAFGTVPIPLFMLVGMFTFLLPYRVLMLRVYEHTHSTFVGIVMHASLTASMLLLSTAASGFDGLLYNAVFAGLLWFVVAMTSVVRRRGALVATEAPPAAARVRM